MNKGIIQLDWVGDIKGGDPVAVFYIEKPSGLRFVIEPSQKYLAEIYIEEEVEYTTIAIDGKLFAHIENK